MLVGVRTPLVVENWEQLMAGHPDSRFRDYILRGLKHGFRIGYNGADMVTSAIRETCCRPGNTLRWWQSI